MENVLEPTSKTIVPSISAQVHLSLTISFTALYGLLFLLIIWQLVLILYYRHRRLSYQTIFLFTCLIWAALRTTLFSFYFKNIALSNLLSPFAHWLLFAFPVYLQFLMLSIMVFYFILVVVKNTSPLQLESLRKRILFVVIFCNIVFLTTDIVSSFYGLHASGKQTYTIIRVVVDYLMFMFAALVLCYCIIKLTKLQTAKLTLDGQGVSYCQAVTTCTIIALLYISRAFYNILAVSPIHLPTFGYGWINVSDQGEEGQDGYVKETTEDYAFISFGCVLFVWELLPTFTIVWFFRVRQPEGRLTSSGSKSDSYHAKIYFFDNPNRYDSDDDMAVPYTPPSHTGLLGAHSFGARGSSPQNSYPNRKFVSSYGSVPPYTGSYNQSVESTQSPLIRGTTPPLLFPRTSLGHTQQSPTSILRHHHTKDTQSPVP